MCKFFNIAQASRLVVASIAICSFQIAISHAQDEPAASMTQEIQVPIVDARLNGIEAIKFSAKHASDDGLALVLYGKSQDLFDQTYEAAQQLIAAGYPVNYVFVGPTEKSSQVDVYTDGQLFDTVSRKEGKTGVATFYDRDIIKRSVIMGYDHIVKPRLEEAERARTEEQASSDRKEIPEPKNW